jgi:hypothetical protein
MVAYRPIPRLHQGAGLASAARSIALSSAARRIALAARRIALSSAVRRIALSSAAPGASPSPSAVPGVWP